jgi:phage baseplate assembly protein W
MPDLFHEFGSDLVLSSTGDVATVDGTLLGQQRVLRRLLTNPGDYIWQLEYGAGLPNFVGQPANKARIEAVTRAQMYHEAAVARNPAPLVTVSVQPTGVVTENIVYADAPTGLQQVLQFNLAV